MPAYFHPPLQLDRETGAPIHAQIAAQIGNRINMAKFNHGERLPTIRTLARQLEINHKIVARAYALLSERGLAAGDGKAGTRVVDPPDPELEEQREAASGECLVSLLCMVEAYGFTAKDLYDLDCEAAKGMERERQAQLDNPPSTHYLSALDYDNDDGEEDDDEYGE